MCSQASRAWCRLNGYAPFQPYPFETTEERREVLLQLAEAACLAKEIEVEATQEYWKAEEVGRMEEKEEETQDTRANTDSCQCMSSLVSCYRCEEC